MNTGLYHMPAVPTWAINLPVLTALLLTAILPGLPLAAQTAPAPSPNGSLLEIGIDDRYHMVSPTATLIQQYFGFSVAYSVPVLRTGLWQGGSLALNVGGETGLSFDATGICRWVVRAIEQDTINARNGTGIAAPAMTADLFFSPPLYLPLRPRIEADLTLIPGWSVQLGGEIALVLLWYLPDRPELRMDAGLTLGTRFEPTERFGLGTRFRFLTFGDRDQWPGVGITIYGLFR